MTVPSVTPSGVTVRHADQVGMIVGVVLVDRRQTVAAETIDLRIAQGRRRVAILDAFEPRDEVILCRAQACDLEMPLACPRFRGWP